MSGYTIGEIVVWLLLAAALGFVLGWTMRELFWRAGRGPADPTAVRVPVQAPDPVTPTTPVERPLVPAPAGAVAKQVPARKTPAKKVPAKKVPAKQAPAKQTPAKQTPARKTTAGKATKRVPPSAPPATRDDTEPQA